MLCYQCFHIYFWFLLSWPFLRDVRNWVAQTPARLLLSFLKSRPFGKRQDFRCNSRTAWHQPCVKPLWQCPFHSSEWLGVCCIGRCWSKACGFFVWYSNGGWGFTKALKRWHGLRSAPQLNVIRRSGNLSPATAAIVSRLLQRVSDFPGKKLLASWICGETQEWSPRSEWQILAESSSIRQEEELDFLLRPSVSIDFRSSKWVNRPGGTTSSFSFIQHLHASTCHIVVGFGPKIIPIGS